MKILISLILFAFPLLAQSNMKGKSLYVLTVSAPLNMRAKAPDGKVIQKIKKGERVKVLQVGGDVASIPYGWVEIEYAKKKGFVSAEFLSEHLPAKLENIPLIAFLRRESEANKAYIQPIAFSLGRKWEGVATDQSESTYFQRISVNKKIPYQLLAQDGKSLGSGVLRAVESSGCQDIKVGKLNLPAKFPNTETPFFAVYGSKVMAVKISQKIPDELKNEIQRLARADFEKKGLGKDKLDLEWKADYNIVDTGKESFAISRVGLKSEGAEHANLIYIHEWKKNKLSKLILSEYQALTEDTMFYGGMFHFEGSFLLDGRLILIFHDNGFDGYIKRIFEWDGNTFKLLATGGGDAC
jgi:hypothetical protein